MTHICKHTVMMRYLWCLLLFILIQNSSIAQALNGKVFIIQNKSSQLESKVIQADYDNLGKNGAKVQLWERQDTPHQIWKFESVIKETNLYYIINQSPKAGKSKYLEAAWITLGVDGGKVQLWAYNGGFNATYGANQVWRVTQNKDGSYRIVSVHPRSSGKVLEVDTFTQHQNGGKVQLYFDVNTQNQFWSLIEIS